MTDRPVIYSTAPLRGPGLDALRALGEVIVDPWIDHSPLRLLDEVKLAEQAAEVGATVLICEADRCAGPVLWYSCSLFGRASRDWAGSIRSTPLRRRTSRA